ncbi:MAG: thioester domain-containing protein, partial [Clostridia bacterium]|nr:thioester domain-containing protein [Clostridia bacterium]
MSKKHYGRKLISLLLLVSMIFSMFVTANAETISDGKAKTVTITMNEKFSIMSTTDGVKLNGYAWSYKTDTGIEGPAYCINFGLKNPPNNKKLTIGGKYTATPPTIGAFAGGYPQRSLEDFIRLYTPESPVLANLTREEYASATQIAIWATLGQVGVHGTAFTSGRAILEEPTSNLSQIRVYEAIKIILFNASFWDAPLESGMHIRLGRYEPGNVLNIEHKSGISGAEQDGAYGIKKETINGIEYYTRELVAASATSTFKNDYFIDLKTYDAPEGTIFTGLDNVPLQTYEWDGVTLWRVPTKAAVTNLNLNDEEYAGDFKICIP